MEILRPLLAMRESPEDEFLPCVERGSSIRALPRAIPGFSTGAAGAIIGQQTRLGGLL